MDYKVVLHNVLMINLLITMTIKNANNVCYNLKQFWFYHKLIKFITSNIIFYISWIYFISIGDKNCETCYGISNNCTYCKNNTFLMYLDTLNISTCVSKCNKGYEQNVNARKCIECVESYNIED